MLFGLFCSWRESMHFLAPLALVIFWAFCLEHITLWSPSGLLSPGSYPSIFALISILRCFAFKRLLSIFALMPIPDSFCLQASFEYFLFCASSKFFYLCASSEYFCFCAPSGLFCFCAFFKYFCFCTLFGLFYPWLMAWSLDGLLAYGLAWNVVETFCKVRLPPGWPT